MQCPPYQLTQQLSKNVAPSYVLYGNESFLIEESASLIRQKIRQLGEMDHRVIHLNQPGASALLEGIAQPSLFVSLRLIEIRFTKLTAEQATQLAELLAHDLPDTYFLFQTERQQTQAKWFQLVQQKGVVIPHWPLNPKQFALWVKQRAEQRGITLTTETLQLLIYHTEGNCLAAAQEIERLSAYNFKHDPTTLPLTQQSQFTVFDICEAALQKQPQRVMKMMSCLKEADLAPFQLLIWALSQSLRALLKCAATRSEGAQQRCLTQAGIRVPAQELYLRLLKQATPALWTRLLAQLAWADQQFKSGETSLAWQKVLDSSLQLAGLTVFNYSII